MGPGQKAFLSMIPQRVDSKRATGGTYDRCLVYLSRMCMIIENAFIMCVYHSVVNLTVWDDVTCLLYVTYLTSRPSLIFSPHPY